MTRREARKSLGSRTHRRVGMKTKVIPGGNNTKKAPKYRTRRAKKGTKSNGAKVQEKLRTSQK
jgi:hypothetical protein